MGQLLELHLDSIVLFVDAMIALLKVGSFLFGEIKTSFLGFREFFELCDERVEALSVGEHYGLIGDD